MPENYVRLSLGPIEASVDVNEVLEPFHPKESEESALRRPCQLCGEDATTVDLLDLPYGDRTLYGLAVCMECLEDEITSEGDLPCSPSPYPPE